MEGAAAEDFAQVDILLLDLSARWINQRMIIRIRPDADIGAGVVQLHLDAVATEEDSAVSQPALGELGEQRQDFLLEEFEFPGTRTDLAAFKSAQGLQEPIRRRELRGSGFLGEVGECDCTSVAQAFARLEFAGRTVGQGA